MSGTPSKTRLRAFRALMFALPAVFFLLLEGGLRFFDYGRDLDLFVPTDPDFADAAYLTTNYDVAERYFSRVNRTPRPPYDMFLKNKPENGFRIFVMGGSTTAGWPYPNNVMFSRVLNQRLSDAFPDRHIEVVNIGIAAINSFTLLDFVDEVLAHEPDAILIYAGHNEFYGALGAASVESLGNVRWIINSYLALLRFKTVQLLRDGVNRLGSPGVGDPDGADYEQTHPTLMSRMIASDVPYGGDSYRLAERHFRDNLHDILARITANGIPVIVSELVSNIRDHAPFVSVESNGNPPANAVFEQGRQLEQQGKYDLARAEYYRAKDLDALRFRASEDFNRIIHDVATAYQVPVVPMKRYFEEASPNGLIGNNLMLEHLHPNTDGYLLMADAFFDAMQQQGLINTEWDSTLVKPASFYAERWPVTDLDRALGRLRILRLMDYWPFRPVSDPGTAIDEYQPTNRAEALAYEVARDRLSFIEAHLELGRHYAAEGRHDLALREYQAIVATTPQDSRMYLAGAMELLKHRQFEHALQFLHGSLKLKDTGIANKWIGHTLMVFRQPHDAVPYLEKAARSFPDDPRVLYNLGGAYALDGQPQRAREILARLERIEPPFPGTPKLRQLIESP